MLTFAPRFDQPPRHREVTLIGREIERRLAIACRRVHRRPGSEQSLGPRQIPGACRLAQCLARIVGPGGHAHGGDEESKTERESAKAAAGDGHGVPPEKLG